MNAPAIVAALFLLLVIVPAPLIWLEGVFHRWLATRIVNATRGLVDFETASYRIRAAEGIEPTQSASLFASVGFVVAAIARVMGAGYATGRSTLVVALALGCAALGAIQDRSTWARPAAFALGATSIVAML